MNYREVKGLLLDFKRTVVFHPQIAPATVFCANREVNGAWGCGNLHMKFRFLPGFQFFFCDFASLCREKLTVGVEKIEDELQLLHRPGRFHNELSIDGSDAFRPKTSGIENAQIGWLGLLAFLLHRGAQ